MSGAWKTLIEHGLPDGAIRPAPSRPADPIALRAALEEISGRIGALSQRDRELLLAWLRGFRKHWAHEFRTALGPAGEALITQLSALPLDENRYLKLRRIAIENLSGLW